MTNESDAVSERISRNAPCPCGSGKKYKLCCGAKAVAAEREAEAKSSQFWTPDGVTAEPDEFCRPTLHPCPKWWMNLEIAEDGTPEGDADRVLNGFLRPYFERYCEKDMEFSEIGDKFQLAILQCTKDEDEPCYDCPSVELVRFCDLWDAFQKKLVEFFSYFADSDFYCEVRRDQMFGGPILTLTDDDGTDEQFQIARPHHYGDENETEEA